MRWLTIGRRTVTSISGSFPRDTCPHANRSPELVTAAHAWFAANADGENSDVYPALENVPRDLFGICMAGVAFAVEYVWGEQENLDGQAGEAQRLHSMFQYNF